MDLFRKNYSFYFLYFFLTMIFISDASKNNTKSHHHRHHQQHHRNRHHHHRHHRHLHSHTHRHPVPSRIYGHQRSGGSIAQQMCSRYAAQACNVNISSRKLKISSRSQHSARRMHRGSFPRTNNRIIGGRKVKTKEYPHMALVGYGEISDHTEPFWHCAGTLISENFVMSAGHCTQDPRPDYIRLGELNYVDPYDDATPVDYKILNIFLHPSYSRTSLTNDISLLKFQGVDKFTDYIRPICLNVLEDIPNHKLVAAGWGRTKFEGYNSKDLLTVELDLQNHKECQSLFQGAYDSSTMLCVGYAAGGKDTCLGDSGGPLQIFNEQEKCSRVPIFTQIGITSDGGNECGATNTPAKYMKVSAYIPWIESIVWN